jgi:glycosyltransferase involved in cell wall biosynthesis
MTLLGHAKRQDPKIPISVVIMTKNEERVLRHTLASVACFDEVFVVDSHSTDSTNKIAEELGAEITQFTWDGDYPKKKEWCLLNLPFANEWVLYLDADELVTPPLAAELRQLLESGEPEHAGYDVELDYYFLGTMLRHGHKVTKRVLVRADRTSWPHLDDLGVTNMWEVEGHYQPTVDGSVGRLIGRLEHYDRDPLFDYFDRHNRYSDWEAHLRTSRALSSQVRGARSARGRRYARLPFKPAVFFAYSYLARRGFLDGRAGFHYAVAHAFYFWQIGVKEAELVELNTVDSREVIHLDQHEAPSEERREDRHEGQDAR